MPVRLIRFKIGVTILRDGSAEPRERRRRGRAGAERAGETGKVMLRVLVDVNGRPKEVKLEKSSGSDRLDKAAIDAARNALLSPHKENGKPREAYVLMPIVFELEN